MLAYGGLGQRQNVDDLAADTPVHGLEVLNDPNAGRVSQGFADARKGSGIQDRFTVLIHGLFRFKNKGGAH